MSTKPTLRLDDTQQFLAMPMVGAHDNRRPVRTAVSRCLSELDRVCGH